MLNLETAVTAGADPRFMNVELFDRSNCHNRRGYGQPQRQLRRIPLSNVAAVEMVFGSAQPNDFYPIFIERIDEGDGGGCKNFRPVLHRERGRHDEWIASAGEQKTFWNLCSYRPTAIRPSGSFTWKKDYVRGTYGVFIDFDCGRKPGDEKCDEPGAMLTQDEVWREVQALIEHEVLPPFQMWADGTRGCYGVVLFDEPEQNVFEAAEKWKELRGYFYRRGKHVAADERARAITQPLKAPGACGVVRYYSTGAPRTSMAKLLEWFKAHPHVTDLSDTASKKFPFSVEQQKRLDAAWVKIDRHTTERTSSGKRTMTWQQKVAWVKARIDDMHAYVAEFGRTGYSRRQFFLDLASAVKLYEFARDNDSERAYVVALDVCSKLNELLDRPLSTSRLKEQVQAADPETRRSSETIRLDMGITEAIAERLNLRALKPASMKVEKLVREKEERARRAEERAAQREAKQKEKETVKLKKKLDREEARALRSALKPKTINVERDQRDALVEKMLREGRATLEITTAAGIHRQQVARIRERLVGQGVELPEQEVLKSGRKGNTSQSPQP